MTSNVTALISRVASVAASAMLIRSIASELIPHEVLNFVSSQIYGIKKHFSSQFSIVIEEFQGLSKNQVYEAAEAYLGSKGTLSAHRVQAGKSEDDKELTFVIDKNQQVCDDFDGVEVRWKLLCAQVESSNNMSENSRPEIRSYEINFHKKHKEKILNSYLPYVFERGKAIKGANLASKLHKHECEGYWRREAMKFDHPMSFKTLAIDSELKKEIIDDLDKFLNGREFYEKTGRAWKRGYLLYGPPGTGKSSLVAAMANYLNYDIYDLDLTGVDDNLDLKNLILRMNNRSILVVEDIDCSIELQNREEDMEPDNYYQENKVTLSGLLNAIDGLWSCCGEERIIVFTTNHKEKLDPALLRPGRMDMHIHLSYCTFSAFQQLAFNYLGISDHCLFHEIEGLLGELQLTPAEIAEELTKKISSKEPLQEFVNFLHNKILMPVSWESSCDDRSQRSWVGRGGGSSFPIIRGGRRIWRGGRGRRGRMVRVV
ncbi:hypothetical protein PIB30_020527 [Stylosanthes scabra]|uniref:AAA+ ATPase domain-containing protein n=1 Tax=Stylosanthes scabra TaxID=79078 RepID=A0ABU6Y7J0_9FABA|nr:hypothetical protein [Stylosanthes scabra]